jgi:predicted transposase/invertase (TIGR01784 family)
MDDVNNMDKTGDANTTDIVKNKLLLPRYDVAFKSLFKPKGNAEVVEDFLRAMLDIPEDEVFEEITVTDPELLPEAGGGKLSVLDVLLKVPGKGTIAVEMQLYRHSGLRKR